MLCKNSFYLVLISFIPVLLIGCSGTNEKDASKFSKVALQGKEIFENKNCGVCHPVGKPRENAEAPDLANAFIANDSMFVQAHLKFVDKTQMPPIQLTDGEIKLLSYYIAELHRAVHPTVPAEEADARCPVCYASVSIKKAKIEEFFTSYLGEKYYFECQDCMVTFEKAPEAFIVLWQAYEAEKVKATTE